ncbi:TatD DNase family protein [Peptoclostridium litorale DSM 5388]|uniref:Putative deoxyribonuclease n=1 Tax=Peptoclostridium litorale DSM 5388 TaxID=1121324 RepID=A0A069RET8_PEPLI|nr:TatD family hydrolase [Peptoclostridium litorale]KDR95554.1 putative deoxyribonuclease [Peptoclostridium litorale DSM 5388]SIN98175.1 TatD DNase family protein [Peptoclostridium litorale DSM 5388]
MFVDVHCHIDQYGDYEMVNMKNVKVVVGAAMDYHSGEKLLSMAQENKSIYACLGIHPEYREHYRQMDMVKRQIYENRENIIAVGEVGLAHYSIDELDETCKRKAYEESLYILEEFVRIAKDIKKPIVLHAIEDSAYDAIRLLDQYGVESALFHWFEGDEKALGMIVERGYYVSVSPDVMYNRRYDDFVNMIPIGNIVFESDGPWEYEGRRGMPDMIVEIAKHLSIRRGISLEEIEKAAYENSCSLFGVIF